MAPFVMGLHHLNADRKSKGAMLHYFYQKMPNVSGECQEGIKEVCLVT